MVLKTYISIVTLNANDLNAPSERHKVVGWIRKQNPHICCLQETHFRLKDTHRLKVKGWEKIFYANGMKKKSGICLLYTSDAADDIGQV